jgi:hypothetical protein
MHVTVYNSLSYIQTSKCIMGTVTVKCDLWLGISYADAVPADSETSGSHPSPPETYTILKLAIPFFGVVSVLLTEGR